MAFGLLWACGSAEPPVDPLTEQFQPTPEEVAWLVEWPSAPTSLVPGKEVRVVGTPKDDAVRGQFLVQTPDGPEAVTESLVWRRCGEVEAPAAIDAWRVCSRRDRYSYEAVAIRTGDGQVRFTPSFSKPSFEVSIPEPRLLAWDAEGDGTDEWVFIRATLFEDARTSPTGHLWASVYRSDDGACVRCGAFTRLTVVDAARVAACQDGDYLLGGQVVFRPGEVEEVHVSIDRKARPDRWQFSRRRDVWHWSGAAWEQTIRDESLEPPLVLVDGVPTVARTATVETPPRLLVDGVAVDGSRVVASYAIVADFLGAASEQAEHIRFDPAPPGSPAN